jgi:putative endonuclease
MKISNPTARLGEEKAVKYLQNKGYKILDRNFRDGYGELDIVTLKDDVLVIVEVKTRSSDKFGLPIESITNKKLNVLKRTIDFYKKTHLNVPDEMRLDAVSIIINGKDVNIEHYENIIYF